MQEPLQRHGDQASCSEQSNVCLKVPEEAIAALVHSCFSVCSALAGAKESSSVLLEDASYGRVRQEFNPAGLWVALHVIDMCLCDILWKKPCMDRAT